MGDMPDRVGLIIICIITFYARFKYATFLRCLVGRYFLLPIFYAIIVLMEPFYTCHKMGDSILFHQTFAPSQLVLSCCFLKTQNIV